MDGRCLRSRPFCGAMLPTLLCLIMGYSLASSRLLAQQSASAPTAVGAESKAAAAGLVFKNVTVVDVLTGRLVPEQTVVVVGHRVQAVGPAPQVSVPQGARVVDARGKYLMPGLWDMHAHLDREARIYYPFFVANGVTGLREMGQTFASGTDSFRVWQRDVAAGTLVGPRTVGPSADLSDYDRSRRIKTPEDVRLVFDSLKAVGVAFVKFRDDQLDPELYFAIARAARQAGLPLVGHLPFEVTEIQAADSGQRSVEHVEENHQCLPNWPFPVDSLEAEQRCPATAKAYIGTGMWMVPTLVRTHWVDMSRKEAQKFVRMMHRFGVTAFLTGTDYRVGAMRGQPRFRPGVSVTDELIFLVGAGLTPLEALQASTINPAKFFNATDSLGVVAPGKLADLVLLDADPLADIHNVMKIQAVVANGRYFDRATLDALDPEGVKLVKGYVEQR